MSRSRGATVGADGAPRVDEVLHFAASLFQQTLVFIRIEHKILRRLFPNFLTPQSRSARCSAGRSRWRPSAGRTSPCCRAARWGRRPGAAGRCFLWTRTSRTPSGCRPQVCFCWNTRVVFSAKCAPNRGLLTRKLFSLPGTERLHGEGDLCFFPSKTGYYRKESMENAICLKVKDSTAKAICLAMWPRKCQQRVGLGLGQLAI